MTDWIKHDGGPQPVADDVWVHVVDPIEGSYQSTASGADWDYARSYFVLNQHLIDAAREEGIRLGLEAAERIAGPRIGYPRESEMRAAIRALDPETIAREAADKETAR